MELIDSGTHRYIISQHEVHLAEVLQKNISGCRYLHIYCDELISGTPNGLVKIDSVGLRFIHIYARSIFPDLSNGATSYSINFHSPHGPDTFCQLALFYYDAPSGFNINLSGHEPIYTDRSPGDSHAGIVLRKGGNAPVEAFGRSFN